MDTKTTQSSKTTKSARVRRFEIVRRIAAGMMTTSGLAAAIFDPAQGDVKEEPRRPRSSRLRVVACVPYQKLNVTLNRANRGGTIDVGFNHTAPLVA
jgi:hypothetical protein